MASESFEIDTNASPFVPEGSWLLLHRGRGVVRFDFETTALYVTPQQQGFLPDLASAVRERVVGFSPCNANVLDYLLGHVDQIPDEVVAQLDEPFSCIVFWGTEYELLESGETAVRSLRKKDGQLAWGWVKMTDGLMECDPAAVHHLPDEE